MTDVLLYKGDCLEEMSKIPDGSVDLVLTDPPYGTTACKWDSVIPFEPMWEQLHRVAKKNAAIVLFGSEPFSSALRMSNIKRYKYDWVWNKKKAGNIFIAKYQPLKIHENILVFGGRKYFPQKTEVEGKIIDPRKGKERINRLDGAVTPKGVVKYANDYDPSKRYPVSIQVFSNHREKENVFHPTQKPVPLLEYLIRTYTQEGETVLDFTMGSGSTGVACVNTGRKFIGIELAEHYFGIAQERISNAQTTPLERAVIQ